jgi:hypothetical protein
VVCSPVNLCTVTTEQHCMLLHSVCYLMKACLSSIAKSLNFKCRKGHVPGQFFVSSAVSDAGGNCSSLPSPSSSRSYSSEASCMVQLCNNESLLLCAGAYILQLCSVVRAKSYTKVHANAQFLCQYYFGCCSQDIRRVQCLGALQLPAHHTHVCL